MTISSAVDASAVARVLGIATTFKNLRGGNIVNLPQRVILIGQGSTASTYALTKLQVSSALQVGQTYGFGSPLHLAALQLLPSNGDGLGTIPLTIYPLVDDVSGVVSDGDITPAGTPTVEANYQVKVNNILSEAFTISVGDVVTDIIAAMVVAVNAVVEMPIIAVTETLPDRLAFTSKWDGASANDIFIEIVGSTTAGNTFAITQAANGATNPDVDDALNQIGDVWETMVLNCMEIADTISLGKYTAFGEGRWGALVRKPLIVFTGNTIAAVASAIAVSDARPTDRINSQLVAPGSNDLPFVVAARQLARIAVVANNNPASDYGSRDASGLTPGLDSVQWLYTDRDIAVKGGSSTIEVKDSVINISDVVTFYHPSGDPTPAYRYVCDIVKVQNIIFNLDIRFAIPEWDGAPLIPDDQATTNATAKKPKNAVSVSASMIDGLALAAIISDPKTAKASILAGINESNPKRLDLSMTVQISGNTNIVSVDLNFGFFFGTAPVVA